MVTPDTEVNASGDAVPFVARWNVLVSALIIEPSIKLVARSAAEFGLYDGEGIYPGNERLARITGYEPETVRKALKILAAMDMAHLDVPAYYDGSRRRANEWSLVIPPDWRSMPHYGPRFARFACQHCGHPFNPQPGTVLRADGTAGWHVRRMVFCPDPGRPKRTAAEKARGAKMKPAPDGCSALWDRHQRDHGLRAWGKLGGDVWKMLVKARGAEWPK